MKKSLFLNASVNFLKTLINIVFPLITFPYATRVLGVDNLGVVTYVTSIISYFSLIATLGISVYAVREGSKYRDDKEKLSKFTKEILLINTISTGIAYFALSIYLIFICKPSLRLLLVISSLTIGFTTYSINWLYQIKEDFVYITFRAFVVQLVALILLFIYVKEPGDYVKYALIQVLGSSGSFVFNIVHAKKYVSFKIREKLELRRHIVPVFMIFGITLSTSIYINLDTVMLGAMVSTYAVGLYEASTKLAQVVKVVITSFSNVLIPRMSYYVANDMKAEFENLFRKCLEYIILFTVPMCIGMALLSKELILLVCGEAYITSSVAASVLAFNVVFAVIDGILYYQILLPYKLEKQAAFCTFSGAVLNLVLNMLVLSKFSFLGAACTTLVSEFVVFLGLSYYSNGVIRRGKIILIILKYVCMCIPMIFYILVIRKLIDSLIGSIALSVLGSVIIYFVMLLITKNSLFKELLRVKRVDKCE